MNGEENIIAAIEVLGECIAEKKNELYFKDILIKDLKSKLESAEKEIAELKGVQNETV